MRGGGLGPRGLGGGHAILSWRKPPKNRQVFFNAYLHCWVKPLNQNSKSLSASPWGVNVGAKRNNRKSFEKDRGKFFFVFVMLHFFLQDEVSYESKLIPSSVRRHIPTCFIFLLSRTGKRNSRVQNLDEGGEKINESLRCTGSFFCFKQNQESSRNTPCGESKLNPPPWPLKKALKMLFASKSGRRQGRHKKTCKFSGSAGRRRQRTRVENPVWRGHSSASRW